MKLWSGQLLKYKLATISEYHRWPTGTMDDGCFKIDYCKRTSTPGLGDWVGHNHLNRFVLRGLGWPIVFSYVYFYISFLFDSFCAVDNITSVFNT